MWGGVKGFGDVRRLKKQNAGVKQGGGKDISKGVWVTGVCMDGKGSEKPEPRRTEKNGGGKRGKSLRGEKVESRGR